jgi:cell division protein DivIC
MDSFKKFLRNYYIVLGAMFVVWLTFFDSNDLYTQYKMAGKLHSLEDERDYYIEKIQEVKEDREELMSNEALLEKFAREKYLMKKPQEDLYIVVEED